MRRISISYGFGENNRYNIEKIPENIQWAIFKYEMFRDDDLAFLEQSNINVNVVHLPLDSLKQDPGNIMDMMYKIHEAVGTRKFVIHPNKFILSFVDHFIENLGEYPRFKLCIENFQWRKKKVLRTPLDIFNLCIQNPQHIGICLDTSHAEEMWLDPKILHTILRPYTEVIHLSNRNKKERKQHMPFNSSKGDLQLMGFVNYLKNIKWNGDLVLEYMPEYQNKIYKNYHFLKEYLNG
jgi:hypothetical protein